MSRAELNDGIALVGGRLLTIAHRRGWMQHGTRRLGHLGVGVDGVPGRRRGRWHPFVSAFVGGLVFDAMFGRDNGESVELAELGGSLLSLVLWFVFGAGFVLPAFEHLDGRAVVYAICSLTVVRMVPVALALAGRSLAAVESRRAARSPR